MIPHPSRFLVSVICLLAFFGSRVSCQENNTTAIDIISSPEGSVTVADQSADALPEHSGLIHVVEDDPPVCNHDGSKSEVYHVYHKKEHRHFIVNPSRNEEKERSCKFLRRRKKKPAQPASKSGDKPPVLDNGYFVHTPYLSFHNPPRTLQLGTSKGGPTVCLIHNSWFWRRWKLQFGHMLSEDGVIDPRGVVSEQHSSESAGELSLRGYGVRSWRLWGECGKAYHREVNEQRKQATVAQKADTPTIQSKDLAPEEEARPTKKPVQADEMVYLDWKSPLLRDVRRYHFQYATINFYWKGTGTVKESKSCGFFLHFNHLKLVASVPLEEADAQPKECSSANHVDICLAKYTSALAHNKSGVLELFTPAIKRFYDEHVHPLIGDSEREDAAELDIRHTRLYDMIVATAMCMIIGEWQKRETVRKILELIATEAAAAA